MKRQGWSGEGIRTGKEGCSDAVGGGGGRGKGRPTERSEAVLKQRSKKKGVGPAHSVDSWGGEVESKKS